MSKLDQPHAGRPRGGSDSSPDHEGHWGSFSILLSLILDWPKHIALIALPYTPDAGLITNLTSVMHPKTRVSVIATKLAQ
ncbi:hypothetical protein GDO81_028397 [Engystomops pustulosus]|uniref:Uncharacterized protein n=1 Tax=Engystomops pustulosus TaxID=76066 RepID=A0AAV6YIQ5_ENGPU|nr:hypothetical protein GDO81_028397 [Engystomops pustulosus]